MQAQPLQSGRSARACDADSDSSECTVFGDTGHQLLQQALRAWSRHAAHLQKGRLQARSLAAWLKRRRRVSVVVHWNRCLLLLTHVYARTECLVKKGFLALQVHRERKLARECQRRRTTRWRYLRTLWKCFRAFRATVSWRASCRYLATAAAERRLARHVETLWRFWAWVVQPRLRIDFRHRRHLILRQKAWLAWRGRIRDHSRKVVQICTVQDSMRSFRRQSAWHSFRFALAQCVEHRASYQRLVALCRRQKATSACSRAMRHWATFRPKELGKQRHHRAMAHRGARLVSWAWACLVHSIHMRRAAESRLVPRIAHILRRQAWRWLMNWRVAAKEQQRSHQQQEEALLQWYVVLCTSAFAHWRRWWERRMKKKARQETARGLYIRAQRITAVRELLCRFHDKRTADEIAVARKVAEDRRSRMEWASMAALQQRAHAREQVSTRHFDRMYPAPAPQRDLRISWTPSLADTWPSSWCDGSVLHAPTGDGDRGTASLSEVGSNTKTNNGLRRA